MLFYEEKKKNLFSHSYRVLPSLYRGFTVYNPKCSIYHCPSCENQTEFSLVKIPYALKLMKQELDCLNVNMRFITA